MLEWIKQNIGSICVLLVVVAVVAIIIAFRIRAKKKGKTSCSCGCANCAGRGVCHSYKQENTQEEK